MISSPTAGLLSQTEYVLKPHDTVRITVYQEDDLTTEARISASGEINFPLLGSVPLAGKTVKTAVSEMTAGLKGDFLVDPFVSLNIQAYAPERISVMGEVKKPGTIEIAGDGTTDILEALAAAGGFTENADENQITLHRRRSGNAEIMQLDSRKLTNPVYLRPLDVVVVAKKEVKHVTVMGQVQRPGIVVLNNEKPFRLLEVIAHAGGYTKTANSSRVMVRREVNGKDEIYLVDAKKLAGNPEARSFFMQPNDVVTVMESLF